MSLKIGVFDPIFATLDLDPMLDAIRDLGLEAVEVATGNFPGDRHCVPADLLSDAAALKRFKGAFDRRDLDISALSCHGNPLHPDAARAAAHDRAYRDTVRLAARLKVPVVNVFSGCPGDGPNASRPNWVTAAWPPDFPETLAWQWEEVVLPYWREAGAFAVAHDVRLGFEMHPGFVVYNPRTLLQLRTAVGDVVGANLDPSHLFWQQIDPVVAIRELGSIIWHVHAKDTAIDPANTARNGVLDVVGYADPRDRSWMFRSVGDGHGIEFWTRFVSALVEAGYDGVLSIEHEDRMASVEEGLSRSIETLRAALSRVVTPGLATQ